MTNAYWDIVLYPYHYLENPELYQWNIHLKPSRNELQYHIIRNTVVATPTIGMYTSLKKSLFQLLRMQL